MKSHSKSYWEGHKAYAKHGATAECPHNATGGMVGDKTSTKRTHWWNGYLDARTDDHLGHVFDKWQLERMTNT